MKISKATKKFLKKGKKPIGKKSKVKKVVEMEEQPEEISLSSSSDSELEQEVAIYSSSDNEQSDNEDEISDELSDLDDDQEEINMELNMQELQEKDPEFYKYLLENDKELLEFNQEEEEEDQAVDEHTVSKEMILQWRANLEHTKSTKTLKKIVMAFKAAACFAEEEDSTATRYKIADEKVFNLVLLTAIKFTPQVLNEFLYSNDTPKTLPSAQKKWKKVASIAKSFLSSLLKILQKMTSLSMTKFVLKTSEHSVAYFACFPKQCKDFLKEMLGLWASSSSHEQSRILAFLCIRKLAIVAPNPYLDICLKKSYLVFQTTSKTTNHHTITQINFMENCIVELGGLFLSSTYQHTFVALRNLALKLRQVSTSTTPESYKMVYNWQYLHSLKLWARMVSTFNSEIDPKETLKPLLYPLVQLILGSLRLKPSSKHFPYRLHLLNLLIDLSQKTGTFIPVTGYIMEIFESSEIRSKPKPSTLKPLDFDLNIRASNEYLGTKTYHTGVIEATVGVIYRYLASISTEISFPEIALPMIILFKKMAKSGQVVMSRMLQGVVEKIEENVKFVDKYRNKLEFGPKDLDQCNMFLNDVDQSQVPLKKYYLQREKVVKRQIGGVVLPEDDEDMDTPPITKASKVKEKKKIVVDGDEDLVEDFELSDEEIL